MRRVYNGFLFDDKGSSAFVEKSIIDYTLGFLNSKIAGDLIKIINPTISFQPGNLSVLPFIIDNERKVYIEKIVHVLTRISKEDWDSFETSWDFKKHPLIFYFTNKISMAFEMWLKECDERFNQLKANEEELNRIFIDVYGLQDELTPEVEDKDVTVRKADLQRDIKSLISYAVGCMFGRYSLDNDGLAYAGGEWDNSKYDTFVPDEDNCIPITDEEYFEDDIVGLFCAWLKKVYGEDTLEENLDFIANALGNKGKTSREVIRNYFLTDFIKDHIKTYQKRPIYWLFDSGKQNGLRLLFICTVGTQTPLVMFELSICIVFSVYMKKRLPVCRKSSIIATITKKFPMLQSVKKSSRNRLRKPKTMMLKSLIWLFHVSTSTLMTV